MRDIAKTRRRSRIARHRRVRKTITGTPERPRLAVHRTNRNISVQIIDDVAGHTLVAASTVESSLDAGGATVDAAKAIGTAVAERARAAGITTVVFDRGGYRYHGRIAALADAAREAGLEF